MPKRAGAKKQNIDAIAISNERSGMGSALMEFAAGKLILVETLFDITANQFT